MKQCSTCSEVKPLSEYHVCSTTLDGRRGKCKDCIKAYYRVRNSSQATKESDAAVRAVYKKTKESRAARKKYNETEKGRASQRESAKNQRLLCSERIEAYSRVKTAVANGSLVRLPCWVCGEAKVEGHHPTYSMPLDVVWLCKKHHDQLHDEVLL